MADSQLVCLDDEHVNVKTPESKPEFYYSEEQRAALEQLLRNGDGAFKMRLEEDNVKDFLSAREIRWMRDTFQDYDIDSETDTGTLETDVDPNADSGVHSTYWPTKSEHEAPPLDLGWPSGGFYRGVTRVSVYTHPPKERSPHIREVVRKLIQESAKVVAVVMDLLTDLLVLQDLLEAACKRGVAVYLLLDTRGLPHFLDMCNRLQITAQHLRNLRVRSVAGAGLALSFGRLPGSLCSKYMLVDGERVVLGSYSFTWSSSRLNRNLISVMSGQAVDVFDQDFRELYAVSEKVDLYKEFHIPKPPTSAPLLKLPAPRSQAPPPGPSSRFQATPGDRQGGLKVPAHKYHNPKYSLVVGSAAMTGSLQDLSRLRDHPSPTQHPLQPSGGSSISSQTSAAGEEEVKKPSPFGSKKQRSSFRLFLKSRLTNQSTDAKMQNHSPESKATNPSPDTKPLNQNKDKKLANHSKDPKLEGKPASPSPAPPPAGVVIDEVDDVFVMVEKPALTRLKPKKPPKLGQKSLSLQNIHTDMGEGFKRNQKKSCIQS